MNNDAASELGGMNFLSEYKFSATPDHNITFSNAEGQVGMLDFNGPEMKFTGNAEESAKVFFDWIAKSFAGRLEMERKAALSAPPRPSNQHEPCCGKFATCKVDACVPRKKAIEELFAPPQQPERCETTLTMRYPVKCDCGSINSGIGPCVHWEPGANPERCPYCDHVQACHHKAAAWLEAHAAAPPQQEAVAWKSSDPDNFYCPHPLQINSGTFWRCKHGITGLGRDLSYIGCEDCKKTAKPEYAHPQAEVSGAWVPLEPTEAMLISGAQNLRRDTDLTRHEAYGRAMDCYTAMLAVVPKAP